MSKGLDPPCPHGDLLGAVIRFVTNPLPINFDNIILPGSRIVGDKPLFLISGQEEAVHFLAVERDNCIQLALSMCAVSTAKIIVGKKDRTNRKRDNNDIKRFHHSAILFNHDSPFSLIYSNCFFLFKYSASVILSLANSFEAVPKRSHSQFDYLFDRKES